MKSVRLGDLCQIRSGGTPSRDVTAFYGGVIPWAKIDDLNAQSGVVTSTTERITEKGLEAIRGRIFPAGTLLFAMYGSVGKLAWAGCELSTNQAILGIEVVNPKVLNANYLFWWLQSQRARFENEASGVTQKNLSAGYVRDLLIPLLPIETQQRIADILDKADVIRREHIESLAMTGDYLRSAYLNRFGDPVANSKGLPERPIAEIATVTTGSTPSREVSSFYGNHIEWIKSDNINTPFHFLTKATEGLSEAGLRVGRSAPAGSTLITCIAGSPSCIGNAALADRLVSFNQQINALTPKPGIEPEFIYATTLFSKARIQAASTNGMKGMVSKGALEQVRFILPPPDQREKFIAIFRKVMALTEKLESAASEASMLYGSLAQRAFQGQLSGL